MKYIREVLFFVTGVISLLVQLLGEFIVIIVLGLKYGWFWPLIIGSIHFGVQVWKHYYFKGKGYKITGINKYVKQSSTNFRDN